jgi:hypothetical protein
MLVNLYRRNTIDSETEMKIYDDEDGQRTLKEEKNI